MGTTTQPAQADRTKCHADCGKRIIDITSASVFKFTHPDFCYRDAVKYCSPACRNARLPPLAPPAPSPAESTTFAQLAERAGPLPTTQLAGAAESMGAKSAKRWCGCNYDDPAHAVGCKAAALPDDIGERLERLERDHSIERPAHRIDNIERRLKALEGIARLDRWDGALAKMAEGPAAPQEQAGHVKGCVCVKCMPFDDRHTGAKP